ncbi:dTDP-4-dehydrorhamnose 3,5-epimerase [Citrobacter amalonaticus]|uniref:dTDP-4-dehydrorhamnose 3,5-epimerase n=1 Tax=Citrobacter amalonaticus TaxID=35703 RepID=A0A2S4S2U3_CITAM|nr:dTDP-4-dehydrorhamnose 3,5-epimerase [Citrobacter amalonaticus]POT59590.1 dTDP-4-dehydrorhamnose 3,5-epimerase [Citrobacter amalonaticus]POT77720.1 dTDP-4-dehydrorhamnose 3,5-epimerase [Citrobacter amalonaticus]POU68172.1 dTDP-4-dehydrorhamnose 3,5-epimerase [Citrobacter amalonaticus]POV07776.1 dTDP-4-dehydrorhamnose 3,5-epimerase [Citrobacter amalonaticus]
MNVVRTDIPDVLILEPKVFGDDRGFFFESFNQQTFVEIVGRDVGFLQDNHSKSTKGVVRGLHYQLAPYCQGKLVRCIAGEVYDVAVDIRRTSPTFGQWVGINLSAENKRQLWIPEGFAHGFQVLSESAEFVYKTTNYYHPHSERGILWNDPDLKIAWRETGNIVLSEKDKMLPFFSSLR